MWTKQKPRSVKGRFILPILTLGVVSYFGYHIYHGEYGLYAQQKIENHISHLQAELGQLHEKRQAIEKRVALLRDGQIEKDMLDEYARRNLNLSLPNERTILIQP
ncbi:FtsB family cell division protein [Bartonella sp. DGB2]|uniref:FtsB family cell division protein n=1 Tax=Bartonella sp. DGB2 TaxID=3388426 RepID=UPI003990006D